MLKIIIPAFEQYDERNDEFINVKEQSLHLEHSLVSLSKWESKWCKSFLSTKEEKTTEEVLDYIVCMTITQHVNPIVYTQLTDKHIQQIQQYIEAPMTATTIRSKEQTINREIITAEIIYYWMVALNIPFECQKWHLNKLLTFVNVCMIKSQDPNKKKLSRKELLTRNAALNEQRKKALNTKG